MDFEDAVNGLNINTEDIKNEEAFKAVARLYKNIRSSFIAEGFTEQEADRISFRVYMDIMMGRA